MPESLPRRRDTGRVLTREGYMLCYVDGPWAWFASIPPTEVWGDDWNDAPHDCNAGEPYGRNCELVKVAFDGDLWGVGLGVHGGYAHERYGWLSVEQINAGQAPWLVQIDFSAEPLSNALEIPAGTALADFRKLVREAGGNVYEARRA